MSGERLRLRPREVGFNNSIQIQKSIIVHKKMSGFYFKWHKNNSEKAAVAQFIRFGPGICSCEGPLRRRDSLETRRLKAMGDCETLRSHSGGGGAGASGASHYIS